MADSMRRALWDDEHAVCPFCDGLMAFNADTGRLECGDCGCDALDAAVDLEPAAQS